MKAFSVPASSYCIPRGTQRFLIFPKILLRKTIILTIIIQILLEFPKSHIGKRHSRRKSDGVPFRIPKYTYRGSCLRLSEL